MLGNRLRYRQEYPPELASIPASRTSPPAKTFNLNAANAGICKKFLFKGTIWRGLGLHKNELRGLHPGIETWARGIWDRKMNERKPLGPKKMGNAQTSRVRKADGKQPRLTRETQARLGQQLRAMYDDVVNQGVPDRFTELLNRINGNESKE
jgi:Anti-sigma factor NepR